MGRYTGPKNKRSRRIGTDLYGNGGEQLTERLDQPPGDHGRAQRFRRRRESEYSRQLREKQKVKWMYGLRERQFRRFYRMAERKAGRTGVALLQLLERRLDNVVYRMGWARTRPQARQMVTHGHVVVNGRRLNVPSHIVEPGDVVALKEKSAKMPHVQALLEERPPIPTWLNVDGTKGEVLSDAAREEISPEIEEQLVVEFYSR
jgi:small subunit ribosomal protein S4